MDVNGKKPKSFFELAMDTEHYIVLSPLLLVAANPYYEVFAALEKAVIGQDTYPIAGSTMLGLKATFIDRISIAAGLNCIDLRRTDDGKDPDFASQQVMIEGRRSDGQVIRVIASKSVDVNAIVEKDYGAKIKKNVNAEVARKEVENNRLDLRKYKPERAESGAKSRAVRKFIGLLPAYSPEDLSKKMFLIPQIAPNMDTIMQDPILRLLAGAKAIGAEGLLFGEKATMNLLGRATEEQSFLPAPPITVLDTAVPANGTQASSTATPHKDAASTAVEIFGTAKECDDEINRLFKDREHGKGQVELDAMLNASLEGKRKYIAWLREFPEKTHTMTDDECKKEIVRLWTKHDHGKNDSVLANILVMKYDDKLRHIEWLAGLPLNNPADETPKLNQNQMARLFAIASSMGYDSAAVHQVIAEKYNGIQSMNDLTLAQYDELCGDEEKGIRSWFSAHPKQSGPDDLPFLGGANG